MKDHQQYDRHIVPYPKLRRVLAITLHSVQHKPMIHGLIEVDVTRPRQALRDHQARTGEVLSFTAFIVTCMAQAVSRNPSVQAYRQGTKRLVEFDDVDVAILVEREIDGEKQPIPYIIRAAQTKSWRDIHQEIRAAQSRPVEKTWLGLQDFGWMPLLVFKVFWPIFYWLKERTPSLQKKYGGTVSVSSVGMFGRGGGWGIPVNDYTLQLTVGGIAPKPAVIDGQMVQRDYLSLTLSFNHDLVDGAPAARFTEELKELMERGNSLGELEALSGLVPSHS